MFEDEMTEAEAVSTDAEYREVMDRERHEAAIDEARAFERATTAIAHFARYHQ